MIKKSIACMLMVFMLAILVSCTREVIPEDEQGTSLVIVIGRHANANLFTPMTLNKDVEEIIRSSFSRVWNEERKLFQAQGNIAIVVIEGKPSVQHIPSNVLFSEKANTEVLRKDVDDMIANVLTYLVSPELRATSSEADMIASIAEAKNYLDTRPGADDTNVKKQILILDSGLSTTGYFNMLSNNIQEGEASDVVSRIPDGRIPKLSGIHVSFFGIGNIASPQRDFYDDVVLQNKLVNIWKEFFAKTDAIIDEKNGGFKFSPSDGEPMVWTEDDPDGKQGGYPRVTVIPIIKPYPERSIIEGTVEVDELKPFIPEEPWVFEASELDFEANSTSFRSGAANARYILYDAVTRPKGIADYLNANPQMRIFVVGSIARTSPQSNSRSDAISAGRAQNVANILREFGIPDDRMVVIDAGVTIFPWRNHDEFPNGIKNANNQQRNRVVAIIPEGSIERPTEEFIKLCDEGYATYVDKWTNKN